MLLYKSLTIFFIIIRLAGSVKDNCVLFITISVNLAFILNSSIGSVEYKVSNGVLEPLENQYPVSSYGELNYRSGSLTRPACRQCRGYRAGPLWFQAP